MENMGGKSQVLWVSIGLTGVTCYVGYQFFIKQRAKKNTSWLRPPYDGTNRAVFVPSTRVYIVRSWTEQTQQDHQTVVRYALEFPATGRRYGFASAELLLDALSGELGKT